MKKKNKTDGNYYRSNDEEILSVDLQMLIVSNYLDFYRLARRIVVNWAATSRLCPFSISLWMFSLLLISIAIIRTEGLILDKFAIADHLSEILNDRPRD